MTDRVEEALETFTSNNCSQAVLATFGPELGLGRADCLRVAACFGAGMGRLGRTCGALTGGFMVLGLRHAHEMQEAPGKGRDSVYGRVQALAERFERAHGSIECRSLIGCDLRTEAGRREFAERGLHHGRCDELVAFVVRQLG
ncbi:MAG TPA: C-GCAxxG-C-C family protein [Polyangiaceae bacterium]|nr:C-GCAxxG-C-C family protein [Polyangiaceae bacterium]